MWPMAELSANPQPFGDWDAEENRMNKVKEKLRKDWISDFCEIPNVLVSQNLSPQPWMHAHLETIVCKFGRNPAICSEKKQFSWDHKCSYHVTYHMTFDLEHTLDACSPGDHHVQVWWRSSHLPARRSDLCKKFTDRQTDDGCHTIALAHWNDLKKPFILITVPEDKLL